MHNLAELRRFFLLEFVFPQIILKSAGAETSCKRKWDMYFISNYADWNETIILRFNFP